MSVLVYLENWEGKFKKNTFEAALYASKTAAMLNTETIGVCIGNIDDDVAQFGKYGVQKVIRITEASLNDFDANTYAQVLNQVATENGVDTFVISSTFNGKAMAPALSVISQAALMTNVVELPVSPSPFSVNRSVFSAKGFNNLSSNAAKRIVVFVPNSIGLEEGEGTAESINAAVTVDHSNSVSVNEVDRVKGKIPLSEAERVVSAGRGLKGPENWGMIEELAEVLDAGTACSKPVSDMDWRPHSEHVGQTGIAIKPNLYIAVGISGAIQHLAGVSASNTIVVINNDDEAPFFKAADYGVIGDAFDVVPRLTEAIKKFKAEN